MTCPTRCNSDCEETCHEVHRPTWNREHNPDDCANWQSGSVHRHEWVRYAGIDIVVCDTCGEER